MSDEPKVAGTAPVAVELEAGKKYAWCTCGGSSNQPFCDGSHAGTSFRPHVFEAEQSGTVHMCMCKRTGSTPMCDGTHASLGAGD